MRKLSVCIIALILATIGFSSCAFGSSSSPLAVSKVEGEKTASFDSSSTEKILTLFDEGEWINGTPNCAYDYIFDYNGDIYRYHSECGTFYSLTGKQSLELNETNQNNVNDMLKSLFP